VYKKLTDERTIVESVLFFVIIMPIIPPTKKAAIIEIPER